MNKYDFGYNLEDGSTHKWAFDNIENGSRVLELGSSNGILTRNLLEKKRCVIDILEIDVEAGEIAKQFAENAYIGREGDLNNDIWYQLISSDTYDYIVILDVLEHLDNPKRVLSKLIEKIKPDGHLLISIPNIAHNSIIINLIKDKFEYTDLGLLDATHKYFVTYESAIEMVQESGFYIEKVDAIKKTVGNNEITALYKDVDDAVRWTLKKNGYGEVYQTLIIASKKQGTIDIKEQEITDEALEEYHAVVLPNGLYENSFSVIPHGGMLEFEIDLREYSDIHSIRVVPMEIPCIASDVQLYYEKNGELKYVNSNWNSGVKVEDYYILNEEDKSINFKVPKNAKVLYFRAKVKPIFYEDRDWVECLCKDYLKKVEESSGWKKKLKYIFS